MNTKILSLLNLATVLLWLVSCTVAHSAMVACGGAPGELPCAQARTCTDDQGRLAVMPATPSARQTSEEQDDCICEHHVQCVDFVPRSLINAGGVKHSTTAPRPSYTAGGSTVFSASAFISLPLEHAIAAAAHARLICLRTTVLRV